MEFTSASGVRYYYDDEIGIAFPSHPLLEKMMHPNPGLEEGISTDSADDDLLFYSRFFKKLSKIRPKKSPRERHTVQAEEVRRLLLRDGLYQLTLGVTEDCNLRCRYCVFSEAYPLTRNASGAMMDYSTAKKALDTYISLIREGQEYNPVRKPSIGFYGGEPLLNFDLIKKCVLYLKAKYPEFDYSFALTTNGTLLTEEREKFFREHKFLVNISIDGPKEEHDRNRVFPNGSGTFDSIWKNVGRFYQEGYDEDSVCSICVFDWKSNLFALDTFFRQADIPKLSILTLPSVEDGSVYYNRFTKDEIREYIAAEEDAFQYYLDHITEDTTRHSVFGQLYLINASRFLYSIPCMIVPERRFIPYSGACIPGKKIFVDVHGNFHSCERINQSFPIGTAESGLDFTIIASMITRYLDHLDSCPGCRISKTCAYCYNHFARSGDFDYASTKCKNEEESKKFEFSRAFTLGEQYPNLLDMVVRDYYTWLAKVSPTLGD
jgi:uncharacterized protein